MNHKPVFFHHIWKTGGTNLFALAKINKQNTFHHCTYKNIIWDSQRLIEKNVTFFEYPGPLWNKINLKDWITIILLRNPQDALFSLYFHHVSEHKLPFYDWLNYSIISGKSVEIIGNGLNPIDNIMVRWIGGDYCNVKQLSYKHMIFSKTKLKKYDFVMITEDFDNKDSQRLQLLQWSTLHTRRQNGLPISGTFNKKK